MVFKEMADQGVVNGYTFYIIHGQNFSRPVFNLFGRLDLAFGDSQKFGYFCSNFLAALLITLVVSVCKF